jgi:hypothetical protein
LLPPLVTSPAKPFHAVAVPPCIAALEYYCVAQGPFRRESPVPRVPCSSCVRCGPQDLHSAMDIDKWLEGTVVAAERTTLPDQLGFPALLHPTYKPAVERSARRYGKRMRHSADSSILEPLEPVAAPSRRKLVLAHGSEHMPPSRQDHGRAPSSAHRAESDANSVHYQRKPRRKTRPERYEAKTAEEPAEDRGKHERKRGKKDKDAKHARKRQEDKSGLADIVQTFHAKNVPRERLTVRGLHPSQRINVVANGSSCNREASSGKEKHHPRSGGADVGHTPIEPAGVIP